MFSAGGKPGGSAVAVRVGGRAILEEQITIRSRGFRFRHRQLVGGGEHLAFRSDRGGRDGDPARFDADHLAGSVDGGDRGITRRPRDVRIGVRGQRDVLELLDRVSLRPENGQRCRRRLLHHMNGEGFGMPAQSVILALHRRIANFTARCGSQPAARPGQLDVLGAAGHRPVLSPPRVFVTYQVNAFVNIDPLLEVRVVGLLGGIGERNLIALRDGGGAGDGTCAGDGGLRLLGSIILLGVVLDGDGGVILAGIAGNSLSLKRHGRAGGYVGGGNGINALFIGADRVLLAGNLEHRLRKAIAVIGGHRELEVVIHGHGELMRRRRDDLVHIRDGGVAQHQLDVGRVGILLRALVPLRRSGLRGHGSAWGGLLLRRRGRRLLACRRRCRARRGRRGACRRISGLVGRARGRSGRGAFHLRRRIVCRGAIAGVHLRR